MYFCRTQFFVTACGEFINRGMPLKLCSYTSQLCFLCCVSVKQELVDDLLAKEKQVESELVGFKELHERELHERELHEAQKQTLSLQQKLEEQKINCKCS